jgi:biopolymer transport protein ExbD
MKNLRSQNKVKAEGGMSSMTDLVFLLLIFFIILSTQVDPKPAVTINYPSPGNDDPNQPKNPTSTLVTIDAENQYYVGKSKKVISVEELETKILMSIAQQKDSTVEIHGDKNSDLGFAMDVVNICKDNRLKLVFKRRKGQ